MPNSGEAGIPNILKLTIDLPKRQNSKTELTSSA
jgi:hypothetical protein